MHFRVQAIFHLSCPKSRRFCFIFIVSPVDSNAFHNLEAYILNNNHSNILSKILHDTSHYPAFEWKTTLSVLGILRKSGLNDLSIQSEKFWQQFIGLLRFCKGNQFNLHNYFSMLMFLKLFWAKQHLKSKKIFLIVVNLFHKKSRKNVKRKRKKGNIYHVKAWLPSETYTKKTFFLVILGLQHLPIDLERKGFFPGGSKKINTGRLRSEVRPLTFCIPFLAEKTPFVYLPLENSTPFTNLINIARLVNKSPKQEVFLSFSCLKQ